MYYYEDEKQLIDIAKHYLTKYSNKDNIDKNKHLGKKYNSIIITILNNNLDDKTINEITKDIDITYLKQRIPIVINKYKSELSSKDKELLIEKLISKINIVNKNAKIERNKNSNKELIVFIEELIKQLLDNKITKKDIIEKMGRYKFNKSINLLKDNNISLYNKYINKYNVKEKDKYKLNIIINNIINDNIDIIDIYLYYDEYKDKLLTYYNIIKNSLNIEERRIFRNFYKINMGNDKLLSEKEIYNFINSTKIIDYSIDKYNNPIPGTGITIDNLKIIKYLKDNNIPITNKTINAMTDRLKNEIVNQNIRKLNK